MPDGSDINALKAALTAAEVKATDAEAKATEAEARAANAEAQVSDAEAQIAALKLMIEKLRHALYGQRSERKQRLLDQMELQLDELEASATEDELAAEQAAGTTQVKGFTRRRRSGRKPFPAHLPRERMVVPPPTSCACCGSQKLSKIGEDVTETLEVIPRQWKVVQTVREKFTCRDCEKISQPPAPFHPTPRGWAGPNLLATIVFEKYGQHQPLNRQRDRFAREGVDLSLSTLADQVGACTVALKPLHDLIAAHVLAADRLHGDETPVPVLAKGKTDKAGPGSMSATTGRSAARTRPRLCSATRGTGPAIIRSSIFATSPASSRPTVSPATTASTQSGDCPGLSPRSLVGHTGAANFSSSPTLRPARGAAGTRRRSRRSRWRAVKRIDVLFDIERSIKGETAPGAMPSARS